MKQTVTLDHAFRVLKLIERIDSFKELDTEGWDSYSAKPIHWHSISNAKMACLLISPASLPYLYPFPALNGEITFENTGTDHDSYFNVDCHPSKIVVAGANKNNLDVDYEIIFEHSFTWGRDLDYKVCALFRDAVMDEKGLKTHLFFVPAQWRKWRAAKKWFQRLTGQKVSTGTQIALAFEDGRLIQAQTVEEFIKRFEEVIGDAL